jgi:hypothetical protein
MASAAPEAHYDVLFITARLTEIAGGATRNELTLFAYLSCLLSVYRGEPPSSWGYRFAATRTYSPYSDDLAEAVEVLLAGNLLDEQDAGLNLTSKGSAELDGFSRLRRFALRGEFLRASCYSAFAMPLPEVGKSLAEEPQLRRAFELSSSRPLLDDQGEAAIMEHFSALADALPDQSDLFVPAVVWLSYLSKAVDDRLSGAEEDIGGSLRLTEGDKK